MSTYSSPRDSGIVLHWMALPKRILIVDDDRDVHGLLRAALDAPDRSIESAYDGLSGLRMVENAPFDLVLTGLGLPGIDGMTLLERVHEARPGTRVVMMTAANTPDNIVRAIRERAFCFFSKPFTVEAVAEMAERALSGTDAEDDIQVLSALPDWLGLRVGCKMET